MRLPAFAALFTSATVGWSVLADDTPGVASVGTIPVVAPEPAGTASVGGIMPPTAPPPLAPKDDPPATAVVSDREEPLPPAPPPAVISSTTLPAPDCAEPLMPIAAGCAAADCGRMFGSLDFLFGWRKPLPAAGPLVTTGPAASAGRLGQPGVQVLTGTQTEDFGLFLGMGGTLGAWLSANERIGIEGTAFYLGEKSDSFTASSDAAGVPVLARPFANTGAGSGSAAQAIALPGFASGSVAVSQSSLLWGAGVHGLLNVQQGCGWYWDVLGGFRYLDLTESLSINQSSSLLPGQVNPFAGGSVVGPAIITVADRFGTRNQFYGGVAGMRATYRKSKLTAEATGSLALGSLHQTFDVFGATAVRPSGAGVTQTAPGGLLAQPSNSGRVTADRFAVAPEARFRLGYQVTDHLGVFVGYQFLYLSKAARPGDQVDALINPGQIVTSDRFGQPGPNRPTLAQTTSDFWAHGVNVGLDFRY
jgi:hypothetical protein